MGLFDFLKKKQPVVTAKDFDLNDLNTDLPPLVGADLQGLPPLPEMNTLDAQPLQTTNPQAIAPVPAQQPVMPQQPIATQQLPVAPPQPNQKSKTAMTVNVAPIDFSMPVSDDHEMIKEELNRLFLSDNTWKEPDWTNFEPYLEPVIEHPTSADFGITTPNTDLPEFDDIGPGLEQKKRSLIPVDVFVKGSDYEKVFTEIKSIGDSLKATDPKIEESSNSFSKEDVLMKDAKENVEFIYKKLMQIEKKIFIDT